MNGDRTAMGWGARLVIGLVLVLAGAAAAVWALGHYRPAARLLGVEPSAPAMLGPPAAAPAAPIPTMSPPPVPTAATDRSHVADLETRIAKVESATARAEGFAGRADALVVAFAARRAIDRGVALGYLEPLLVDRFGAQHQAAVATIVTASRQPVRLTDLADQYRTLGPDLRRGGPQDNWWSDVKHQLGSLIEIHRAERPAVSPDARYVRALQRLDTGDVDQALAETMRMPGVAHAAAWIDRARRYVAAHRALDEVESAALMPGPVPPAH